MTSLNDSAGLAVLHKGDEDFAGLWEIPAVVVPFGEDPVALAKRTVGELYIAGLVQLVWGDPDPHEDSPIPAGEAEHVLSDTSNWNRDQPYAGRQVWLYTTAAGQQHLAGGASN